MGEREKVELEKRAALKKRFKAAVRWSWLDRAKDVAITLGIVVSVLVGYYRHVYIALALLAIVLLLAWLRFRSWDNSKLPSGHADVWDISDDVPTDLSGTSTSEHWHDTSDHSSSFDSADSDTF